MNVNLLNAVRSLVSAQGAAVLLDLRRMDENLPVFAGKEPAADRKAFLQCLAAGLPGELQRCPDKRARLDCKNRAAQRMAGQGLAAPLVKEIVDLVDSLVPAAGSPAPRPAAPPSAPRPLSPPPANRQPEQRPAYQAESTVPVQAGKPPGGPATGTSRKTLVFGAAGGIGAVLGELLSEPIVFVDSPSSSSRAILEVAAWSALISLGLAVGLLLAQSIYLKKTPRSKSFIKTMVLGILSGIIAGAAAQLIFSFTQDISTAAEIISRIICWGLVAAGVGLGVSLFVPNYPWKRAMLAGLTGGNHRRGDIPRHLWTSPGSCREDFWNRRFRRVYRADYFYSGRTAPGGVDHR
jgi:hypothetical protein